MTEWSERLREAMRDADMSAAELARRLDVDGSRIRKYVGGNVEGPRGDLFERMSATLGVETLWLRDGLAPKRPGDLASPAPGESGDDILHRREMAQRIAGERQRRRIASVESAAAGTVVSSLRWRKIEAGEVAPTPLELRAISERLWCSLDWIVGGHVTPIDDVDAVGTDRARRHLQEENSRPMRNRS